MPSGNTFQKTAITFSGIVKDRQLKPLPLYLMLIASNAMPVYGAATGKLVFFQMIYLYWFESLLLIIFDCIRIAAARGKGTEGEIYINRDSDMREDAIPVGFGMRLSLILRSILFRTGLLLFYLVFIVVFVGLQVTDKAHRMDVAMTMGLQNPFFNAAVLVFLINMTVQLIGGFFLNGRYKTESPRSFYNFLDGRTILMHVMIVGSVFIHQYFFEHKAYEAWGEVVYVGIFMLIRTILDLIRVRSHFVTEVADQAPVLI
jgi:hypothetical protein